MVKGLVSVVITTFGRDRELLWQAINSVKNQTYDNIELIIVDDNGIGLEIQKQNAKVFGEAPNIVYIANAKNYGAQYSRNHGIMESNGEFIAFLDDDDIWMPEKIAKQVALIEEKKAALVFCNGLRFYNNDLNDTKIYQQLFISDKPISYELELRGDRIGSTSHPLMRKECIARTGLFDLDMPARQDYEMWLRFCKNYEVWGIDEPLFYYRYHDGERITKSYKKELTSYKLLWKKYRDDYKKDNIARASIQFTMSVTHMKGKSYIKAFIWGIRALCSNPKHIFSVIHNHKNGSPMF